MTSSGKDPDDLRVGAISGAERATGPEAAEAVVGASGTRGAAAVDGVGEAGSVRGTEAITSALASGAIDAAEARSLLIEDAVRAQLPAGADAATIAAIREEVEAVLAADPTLDALLSA
jgi:hypothetical protein